MNDTTKHGILSFVNHYGLATPQKVADFLGVDRDEVYTIMRKHRRKKVVYKKDE